MVMAKLATETAKGLIGFTAFSHEALSTSAVVTLSGIRNKRKGVRLTTSFLR